jgi:hypothetical protein
MNQGILPLPASGLVRRHNQFAVAISPASQPGQRAPEITRRFATAKTAPRAANRPTSLPEFVGDRAMFRGGAHSAFRGGGLI